MHFKESCRIIKHPMADGGDGSLDVLSQFLPFEKVYLDVLDPLGRKTKAYYCIHEGTAYIELAVASGITLVEMDKRNPRFTCTFGTGQLIKDAVEKGNKKIMLFLGGSSTNDAGIGIASALGFNFYNKEGHLLEPVGDNLALIAKIEYKGTYDFGDLDIKVLCDVNNPLFGPTGAAHTFGRQKGASDSDIELLDFGLKNIARVYENYSGLNVQNIEGAGAAGGIGAGLTALCNARLVSGFDLLSEITGLEEALANADVIISGEGKIDDSSFKGKVVGGISNLALRHNIPLLLVCGVVDENTKFLKDNHLPVFDLLSHASGLEDAIENSEVYLRQCCDEMVWEMKRIKDNG